MHIDIQKLSTKFYARILTDEDTEAIFALSSKNKIYYKYHPPFVTRESILEDMRILPPDKSPEDKYYLGFFREDQLAAVMDLVLRYPNPYTAYIGFFMMEQNCQGKGIGSELISDCAKCLAKAGFEKIRLAVDKGNPQSYAFWTKNGFVKTGEEVQNPPYIYFPMERSIAEAGADIL